MKPLNGPHRTTTLHSGENGSQTHHIRYAVVGLGNIAQVAVLPAFLNAAGNSRLTALVSDDPKKLKTLAKQYKVKNCYNYAQYDECLESGEIDAVYVALPNHMHRDFAVRAAHAGIHVLCEKPLAIDEAESREIIDACDNSGVKLMTAYRLHFEKANLKAIKIMQSGKLGELRFFNSTFSMQVKEGIRTRGATGGGTLYDIGIYCINAARYLFQANPTMAMAFSTKGYDKRFQEVDEMTSAVLRFPQKRFANFTCSFGAMDTATYEVVGTKGTMRVCQAYEFTEPMKMEIKIGGKTTRKSFLKRDQFGPELVYFSDCILHDRLPEPSGLEGLTDVQVIRALYKSARTGRAIELCPPPKRKRTDWRQEITKRAREPLALVHTESPNQ